MFDIRRGQKTIPDPEVHHGLDGLIQSQAKFAEIFDDLRVEANQVLDVDDRVLALGRVTGRDRQTGLEVNAEVAAVWTMRGGHAIRCDYYNDRAEALKAVGLSE